MKATVGFVVSMLAIVGVLWWVMALVWVDPAGRHALAVSAGTAVGVQLFAYGAARLTSRTNVLAGWALGIALRLVVLVLYGFVIVRALGLPMAPALLSLAVFFFATTLVEPLWLRS